MDTRQEGGRLEKSESAFRTISEVASDLDIPQHVLRFWEGKFPQIKPLKRAGGRRYYRPEDVALLRRIRDLLYGEGYTIKGVQKLLRDGGVRTVAAPPVVEIKGGEPEPAAVDIIEEDDADDASLSGAEPIVTDTDDSSIAEEKPVVLFPEEQCEEQHTGDLPIEEESLQIALESVLETTPDELLNLFPTPEEVVLPNRDDPSGEEDAAGDNTVPLQAEGNSPDLSPSSFLIMDEPDDEPLHDSETSFPVLDLSTPLDSAEDSPEIGAMEDMGIETETVVVDRASLLEILTELEALRSLLKGGAQADSA